MKKLVLAVATLAFLAACASSPSDRAPEPIAEPAAAAEAPRIVETDEFLVFLDTLQADIEVGEPRELTSLERRRVNELADELREMLSDVESVEQLNNNAQIDVYNTTQALWSTVVGRAEDQVICRREHRVGTNFKSTRCRTVEQIREDQRQAARYLQGVGPGPMPKKGVQ
ncbi:hypothetical protein [Halomonas denitrificans]|nr:hypothetical protein [Halomonas denitrificans]